jgi:hypothetical protein
MRDAPSSEGVEETDEPHDKELNESSGEGGLEAQA